MCPIFKLSHTPPHLTSCWWLNCWLVGFSQEFPTRPSVSTVNRGPTVKSQDLLVAPPALLIPTQTKAPPSAFSVTQINIQVCALAWCERLWVIIPLLKPHGFVRFVLSQDLNVCFPLFHPCCPLAWSPSFQRPVLEPANRDRRARSATTSTPTLPVTPRERWGEYVGRNLQGTISGSYFLNIHIWADPFMRPAVRVFRLSSCTSGSSRRSAVRMSKELWSCLHRARRKPVPRATRGSSSPTRPPVNPASKVPTPTEQVWNSQTLHVTLRARQTGELLSWCTRVCWNVI